MLLEPVPAALLLPVVLLELVEVEAERHLQEAVLPEPALEVVQPLAAQEVVPLVLLQERQERLVLGMVLERPAHLQVEVAAIPEVACRQAPVDSRPEAVH